MIGLILKDFYTLRQYCKTMLFMLVFFALISLGLDNPAAFFEGFIILMSMMMSVYSFSYDNLAKWDHFGLSLPITRKEVVASKYILSLLLCLIGAALSFVISTIVLYVKPIEDFGLTDHLVSIAGIVTVVIIFFSLLLPLIFKFGVEKSRMLLIAIFAAPTAVVISLDQLGIPLPSDEIILSVLKILPILVAVLYFLSYLLSVKIYSSKEI